MITLCCGLLLVGAVFGAPANEPGTLLNARQERAVSARSFAGLRNACDCVCGGNGRESRVVGGEETRPHEFPWVVWLSKKGEFYCGASLITRRHVLTAAHCVNDIDMATVKVTLADHDRASKSTSDRTITRKVRTAKMHESFNKHTYNNDIAVLELDIPVEFSSVIRPACLPQSASDDYTGRVAILSGWGRVEERQELSSTLRKVSLPVWSLEACRKAGYLENRITENMFCAGYPDGKLDACQGDSGGPLNMSTEKGYMEVIGLVSWGRGCARAQYPGVYTKISNYKDWIDQSLNGECMCHHP